jgi:hypothetical protein
MQAGVRRRRARARLLRSRRRPCRPAAGPPSLPQPQPRHPNPNPNPTHKHGPRAVILEQLEDQLYDLEDELDLAAEEAFAAEDALADEDGVSVAPPGAGPGGRAATMADLEGGGRGGR